MVVSVLSQVASLAGLLDGALAEAPVPVVRVLEDDALQRADEASNMLWTRPAHILGGWMRFTPRFPKDPWEIMKIHDFSWIFNEKLKTHQNP